MRWYILIGRHKEHQRPARGCNTSSVLEDKHEAFDSYHHPSWFWVSWGIVIAFARWWWWRQMENHNMLWFAQSNTLTVTGRSQYKCQTRWRVFWTTSFPTAAVVEKLWTRLTNCSSWDSTVNDFKWKVYLTQRVMEMEKRCIHDVIQKFLMSLFEAQNLWWCGVMLPVLSLTPTG